MHHREVMETFVDKKDAAPLQRENMQNIDMKKEIVKVITGKKFNFQNCS